MLSEAYIRLAEEYIRRQEKDKAIIELEKFLNLHPDNLYVIRKLAELYFALGNLDKALDNIKTVISSEDNVIEDYNLLGAIYYEKGNLSEAYDIYKKAISIDPRNGSNYNNLAVVLSEMGEIDEALKYYLKSLKISPNNASTLSNTGVCFYLKEKKEEAKKYFLKSLKEDPNEVIPHYFLGLEYENKGTLNIGQVIKIGQMLKIHPQTKLNVKDYTRMYQTKVEDITNDSILIAAPLERGVVIPFRAGMTVIVGKPDEDALYGFQSEIIERVPGELPMLRLSKKKSVRRIQRRKYVRVQDFFNTKIKLQTTPNTTKELRDNFKENEIKEKNLSAGGMLLVSSFEIPRGTLLEIYLNIEKQAIRISGEVVRTTKDIAEKDKYEIGINFLNLKEKERDLIIRFVFARQLDLRKRGLF